MQFGELVVDCLTFRSSEVPKQKEQRTWQRWFVWGPAIWFVLARVSEEQCAIIIPQLFFKNKSIYRDRRVDWALLNSVSLHPKQARMAGGYPLPASAGQKQLLFH